MYKVLRTRPGTQFIINPTTVFKVSWFHEISSYSSLSYHSLNIIIRDADIS